jgi:PAS domain S-box-containing protein
MQDRNLFKETWTDSQTRSLQIAEAAPVMIWTSGVDTLCNYVNQPWLDFTGRKLEQELGNGWSEGVHPEDLEGCVTTYLTSFEAKRRFTMEYRLRRSDGEYRWILDSGVPRYSSDGSFEGFIGSCVDITEHKRAQQALRRSEEHFRSLFANMNEGVAYCKMLFDGDEPQDFVYEEVNSAFQQLTGLKDVVGKRATEVLPGIREANPELFTIYGRVALTGEPAKFESFVEPLSIWLSVSVYSPQAEHFVAVFDNITERKRSEEALRASGERHRTILQTAMDGFWLADTQARIFDPFFTTKEVGKGTGLGLSMVYGIAKQSDGYITVHSEPGHGAEFKIYLPRVLETPEPVLAPEVEPLRRGAETILVAEDEASLRELVRKFLKEAGYQVLVARDVKDAIQIVMQHKGPLDLLLTDVVMPDLSGPQLAEHLQSLRPEMKVLYMSGYSDALIARSMHGLETDLINKPFTEQNLLRRLREVLEGRKL